MANLNRRKYEAALERVELFELSRSKRSTTSDSTYEVELLESMTKADYERDLGTVNAYLASLPEPEYRRRVRERKQRQMEIYERKGTTP